MRTQFSPAMMTALTLAAAVLFSGTALRAETVSRGPYLQSPTKNSIVVVWEHPTPAAPVLRWGLSSDMSEQVVPAEHSVRHEILLEGLQPGEIYYYALHDGEETFLTEMAAFPTAVESGTPFRFLLYGDTRTRHDIHATVVEAMLKEPDLRFYVHTGDLVSRGAKLEQWDTFFEIEHHLMRRTPFYPVIGNHEEHDGIAPLFEANFVLPDNSPDPGYYYSFVYGNVHIQVLDGHVHSHDWDWCVMERHQFTNTCFSDNQLEWLHEDLRVAAQNPDVDHIIVVTHVGPYSSKENRRGSGQMRELLPFFREMGVDFIVSGHDHYYERGISGNGIPYVITGGGGAPLYDIGAPSPDPHEVIYNEMIENYLLVDVEGPLMHVVAKTPGGRIMDEFTIDSTPECTADEECEIPDATPECPLPEVFCSLGGRCSVRCLEEDPGDPVVPDEDPREADVVAPPAEDVAEPPHDDPPAEDVAEPPHDDPPAVKPPEAGPPAAEGGGGCSSAQLAERGPAATGFVLLLLVSVVLVARRRGSLFVG